MTKAAALYQFFSQFGLDAYEENSVYTLEHPPAYPYLTYELQTDAFGEYDVPLSFSLWYYSASWHSANAKVEEISALLGQSGVRIRIDGGFILIMRGSPFAQSLGDPSDDMIRRKLLNVTVRFYTSN